MSSTRTLHRAFAALSMAALAFACGMGPANARYDDIDDEPAAAPVRGTPLLAVVGLAEQRITIYGATGKMMEAPVSSGQSGLETPAGIFSIVQKEEDHHSNLFEDGSMPFMERITWTGISLHAGVLPGYPASHGCVRMPRRFAEQLYDVTNLGMRVILVREDIAPAEVAQPAMFTPTAPLQETAAGPDLVNWLKSAARTKYMESVAAQKREREAKQAAAKRSGEAAASSRAERAAEAALAKAEADLTDAGRRAEPSGPAEPAQAEAAKTPALAKVEAARAQLEAARRESQSKSEAARRAEEELRAAAAEAARAADASDEAQSNLSPVSVFISRKTQRLFIRRNNMPVYEGPVTIRDADRPIGSFVFTALDYTGTPGSMRWNVVSMYKSGAAASEPAVQVANRKAKVRQGDAAPADVEGAEAALSRIAVTEEAHERISAAVLPGSSLIVSDEGPGMETGKDTDFVVVMSGEPMGGLTSRHRPSRGRDGDEFFGDGFFGRFSSNRRGGGGGGGRGFPFFFFAD